MNRRELTHLGLLLAASALIRYALIPHVGVFGDFGFWAYDSRMVLLGKTPYIDFVGRSPLTVYSLAATRAVFGMSVYSMRTFVILHWTAAAAVLYGLTRSFRDHRTGLVAVLLATLTPVPLVYGMWLNSQAQAGLLAMLAVAAVWRWPTLQGYALAGGFVGAGLLARRSLLMVAAGIGLWTVWRHYHTEASTGQWLGAVTSRGLAAAVPALTVPLIGYGFVVGFGPNAIELFRGEVLGVVFGQGSYPILGVDVPAADADIEAARVPILNDLCQLCGAWTARIGFQMLILSMPAAGFFWWYTRDITDHHFTPKDRQYMFGALALLGAYAGYLTFTRGFTMRFLTLIAIAGFAIVAYRLTDGLDRDLLYHPGLVLVVLVAAAVVLAYLYRDRRIHVYYLMDAWPWYSIIGASVATAVYRQAETRTRVIIGGLLALALLVSTLTAAPFVHVTLQDNAVGWFTVNNMAAGHADLEARAGPGGTVFTARPNYVVGTSLWLAGNVSRSYKIGLEYGWSDRLTEYLYGTLREGFREGSIDYVILSNYTGDVLAWDDRTQHLFETRYCRVPGSEWPYNLTNAELYAPAEDCGTERPNVSAQRPPWDAPKA